MGAVTTTGTLGALQGLLEKHKGQIAMALPRHMTPERMIRIALSAVSGNYLLAKCEPVSIAACIVQASILGLEPHSALGEAYLVPFWNKKLKPQPGYQSQLIVGYQGLVKLARNSGQLSMIDAQPVHANDHFEFQKGSDTFWVHKWDRVKERGPIQGYWAGYVLKDGARNFEYMTVAEIEAHRAKYSKGAYDKDGNLQGPWRDSPDWMFRKTPLRQVIKLMPKSVEVQTALTLDERADIGLPQTFVDVPAELLPPTGEEEDDAPKMEQPRRKSEQPDLQPA